MIGIISDAISCTFRQFLCVTMVFATAFLVYSLFDFVNEKFGAFVSSFAILLISYIICVVVRILERVMM